jgi:hypothetical protein
MKQTRNSPTHTIGYQAVILTTPVLNDEEGDLDEMISSLIA